MNIYAIKRERLTRLAGSLTTCGPYAVRELDNSRLVGVVSRDLARAQAFAEGHGEPGQARAHDDLATLLADPHVDAVYVATPPDSHREHALRDVKEDL